MMVDWMVRAGLVESKKKGAKRVIPAIHCNEMAMMFFDQLQSVGIGSDPEGTILKLWKGENEYDKACNIFGQYLPTSKDKLDRVAILFIIAEMRLASCNTEEFKDETKKTAALDAAIRTFKQIIDDDPFYAPWAEMGITQCLAFSGKKTEAFAALDKIAATWPTFKKVAGEAKEYIKHPETARLSSSFEPSEPIPVNNGAPLPSISKTYNISMSVVGGVLVLILLGVRLRSWRKARSTRKN
jgi:tetratricopeptide (TPR) repeat protein